jgi:hypothetical protein
MFAIKINKRNFDASLKQKYINVIERVAGSVEGLRKEEMDLIDRFKKDIELIIEG